MPDHNKDKDVPWSEIFQFSPVIPETHDDKEKIPIFWGPGQYTQGNEYPVPINKEWHKDELLSIPQVVRFVYSADNQYDTEEFPEEEDTSYYYQIAAISFYNLPPYDIPSMLFRMEYYFQGINQGTFYNFGYTRFEEVMGVTYDLAEKMTLGLKFQIGMGIVVTYTRTAPQGEGYYIVNGGLFPVNPIP